MVAALEELKILDFTYLLPGPYATMYLADFGAKVLRISSSIRQDPVDFIPPLIRDIDISAASAQLGRNKRLMVLNLKDPRAITIIHKLIKDYDIIIEQFRPGVMKRLKLSYDELKKVNPNIIYCSISGYGQTGPLKERAGHDVNYIARSGLASYSGTKEDGPCLSGMQIADIAAGSNNAIIGILTAVIFRKSTGRGQFIDISMTDGAIAFNSMIGAAFLVDSKDPEFQGNSLNGGSLYGYYKTKDGRYISFGGVEKKFFVNFCNVINRPDLIEEGVEPKNLIAVKRVIEEILLSKTQDEWIKIFNKTDACVEPVMTLSEVVNDVLAIEREMFVEIQLPNGSRIRQIANPIKFSETKPEYKSIGVTIANNHTIEVLQELGYSEKEINEFLESGLLE